MQDTGPEDTRLFQHHQHHHHACVLGGLPTTSHPRHHLTFEAPDAGLTDVCFLKNIDGEAP